jgi:hypothetical protein
MCVVQVTFKLFGVLPGAVGLRGTVLPVQAGQPHGRGTAGEGDTVRVLFEPPVLSLGSGLHFRIGAVQLHVRCESALPSMPRFLFTCLGCPTAKEQEQAAAA